MARRPATRSNPLLILDRIAAVLVSVIGCVHLAVGLRAFSAPTEHGVWFLSAGFLLITTGLANLACGRGASRLQSLAGASGSVAILVLGALLAAADRRLLASPQTLVLLALGLLLSGLRLRELLRA